MRKLFTLMVLVVLGSIAPALAQTWTVTYPAGGSAASVDDVQVKCDVAYRYLADDATASLYDASDNLVKTLVRDDITLSFKGSYCLVDFEFDPAITTPGEYKISVPEGTFIANDQSVNPAFSVSFSVVNAEYEQVEATWSCVMPEGGKDTALEYIILASDYVWDVVNTSASGALYNSSFETVATLTNENFYPYEGSMMVILPQAVTTPGAYMLVVNENAFVSTAAGVTNAMFAVELAVEQAQEPLPVPEFEVTYPIGGSAAMVDDVQIKCTNIAYRYLADDATAKLYDGDGQEVKTLVRDDINLAFKGSYCLIDFEFDPAITTPGDYKIIIPEGTFITNDNIVNPEFTVPFTVESAEYQVVEATWSCLMPEGGKDTALEYIILASDYAWDVVTPTASGALYNSSFETVATLTNENFYPYEGNMMVILPQAVTTPGAYMLVVDERSFVFTPEAVTNAMFAIELAVEEPEAPQPQYEVSVMPEDGSTVSEWDGGVQAIYVTVNGYSYASPNDSGIKLTISKDGEEMAQVDGSALIRAMDRVSACIDLPEDAAMSQPGEYTVEIPEGYFLMTKTGSSDETLYQSPALTLHYTVTPASTETLTWTISPEPGTVDKLDEVKITFNKPVKIALTPFIYLFYSNYSYMPETMTEGAISVSDDGLTATIKFDPVFEYGGVFQVRIYEGNEQLAVVDGEPFPGIRATYKVNAPLYTECTPESGSTVDILQETKVTLRYNTNIAATDNFSAWYVCGEERVKANLTKLKQYDFGDLAYIVVSADEPITTGGTWTLVIEEGSLEISNYGETMPSPETSVEFIVSGTSLLQGVATEREAADVYSLQGVLLKKNATAEEVKNLAPGVYVIGGKKTYIK